MKNYYRKQPAEQINLAIAALPTAEKTNLISVRGDNKDIYEDVPKFKAVRVKEHNGDISFVQVATPVYQLVQHEDAFRPIIEGMTLAGVSNFEFVLWNDAKQAQLQIYSTGTGFDSVSIGFSVTNSFDGHSRIKYGIEMNAVHRYIEVVGYRQACSNGMIVRVPLAEAEFVRPEIMEKITVLLSDHKAITHTKTAEEKVKKMQYIVEAVSLLREPVDSMVKAAKLQKIDTERLKEIIKLHIGQRYKARITEQFESEDKDLWGLFNAITHVASHTEELKDTSRQTLLVKAADMLKV